MSEIYLVVETRDNESALYGFDFDSPIIEAFDNVNAARNHLQERIKVYEEDSYDFNFAYKPDNWDVERDEDRFFAQSNMVGRFLRIEVHKFTSVGQ